MTISYRMCPVCGQSSELLRPLFHPKLSPGPISMCENCHMVYVATIEDSHALIFDGPVIYDKIDKNILTSSNLDDVSDSWELKYISEKETEMPFIRQNAKISLEKIDAILGKGKTSRRILDFGAGCGFFLSVAKERGWEAYGLEPLPATAVYARAKFGLNILTDTIHETSFPEGYFDVVTAFQVLEHLPNPLHS